VQTLNSRKLIVSADAESRVRHAQDWIAAYPADAQLLLLTHSKEAASDLILRVVTDKRSAFGIRRFTLNSIAARLAQHALADAGTAPATNLSFTAVVARAVHSLNAKSQLDYFAPVVSRPGFPIAVARTLAELRMNEVEVTRLAKLNRGGKDLAAIATLVEEDLRLAKLSDRSILFQAAIDSLDASENQSYVRLPLLLVDVVVTSQLELKFVQELAARSPSVLVTAPLGDERTIRSLEQALQTKREEVSRATDIRSIELVKQHLFQSTAPAKTKVDSSVQLHNWPGEPRECVEIVRSIQAEATAGVPFDRMAVFLNSPGEYRAHLDEAFTRANIPVYFFHGTTTPDPAGRALLALLSCAAEGLSAKRFAEYLSLGQMPEPESIIDADTQWVGPTDDLTPPINIEVNEAKPQLLLFEQPQERPIVAGGLRAPARWERLLVDSAVIGGKDRWIRRLEGLRQEFLIRIKEATPEEEALVQSIQRQLSDLESLREYALPLIDRLAHLPSQATWGEWLAHIRELSLHALREPENVLATIAELDPMSSVGPVDLHEAQLVLESRMRDLRVKPPLRRYGRVFVGPVDAARGMSFKVVFVPGLAERIFPRKIVEDPILTDSQRLELDSERLTTRKEQLEGERLGLRMAVGATGERVYLSYPRIDVQQSRPRVPSFYALEALRAAEGELPGFEEVAARAESSTHARLGWPAPEQQEFAIDEAEYDLALLANLSSASKTETTGAAHYLLSANPHLGRALRARTRRWLRRWTPNDGLVDPDELAKASIARHEFGARSFSATALQNFASCPYRFFLSGILRFDLRQEPAAIEVIDPLTRGSLFHETQFQVLTALKAAGKLPLRIGSLRLVTPDFPTEPPPGSDSVQFALDLIDAQLDQLGKEYEDRLAPAIPRVWQDGLNSIRADLREWLRRLAEGNDGWIPDKFELSFGLTDRGPRDSDPSSIAAPVEIIGDLKLRGSIDMVERQDNKFRVTDHKTGKARAERNTVVGGGKYLQPLLYALACQKLLDGQIESGRLYYCTSDGGYEDRVVALNDENVHILSSVLSTVRQGLVDGFLPAAPDKDACMWCDFLAVCGSAEEQRVKIKPKDRLIQIKAMRELP
jgi:ATP-dependent helicase/nuclease subunit B